MTSSPRASRSLGPISVLPDLPDRRSDTYALEKPYILAHAARLPALSTSRRNNLITSFSFIGRVSPHPVAHYRKQLARFGLSSRHCGFPARLLQLRHKRFCHVPQLSGRWRNRVFVRWQGLMSATTVPREERLKVATLTGQHFFHSTFQPRSSDAAFARSAPRYIFRFCVRC